MARIIRYITFLVAVIFSAQGKGQTYPVQAFVQITPPFTSYLPDYSDPFTNQMKVLLTLTDFTVPSYQVKLRFKLEGNGYTITTASLLPLPTATLTPGVPTEISGADLAPYLNSANLIFSGIDVADYEMRKVLPEGPVSVCVEVIDFSNPNQSVLSNPACSQVWFSLNDPPLLNTPFCGNQINVTDPQQIIFSWTPLHMNSPYSMGTQYTFELFEIRPNGADPNQVVNSTLPIFMQVTDQTFINYGIIEPQLQVGMSYVWRVRAQDIQGRDFFRNKGYSAVCTFTYGNIAASLADGIVLELNSNGTGVRQGMAWWNASATFTHYILEIRKTGNPDFQWFPYEVAAGDTKINSLEPFTEYECRVKGLVGDEYESEWSNISVFKTQAAPDYSCGSTSMPAKSQGITPLLNATAGMYFSVGQFEMMVTDIEPVNVNTMPGHYKGTGKIAVGFGMINMRVKFADILVDEQLMVRTGKVEAITEGIEAWENSLNEPDYYVDGVIENFEWNDSTSLTVWVDGVQQEFEFPENGILVIQDEEGMVYTFNADGTFDVFSILVYSDDHLAATKDYRIDFSADENQTFGFDKKTYSAWLDKYEVIQLDDNTNYFVAFKSLAPGEGDVVFADITSDQILNGITFITSETNTTVSAEKINNEKYQLTLPALSTNEFIYAWHNNKKIGKLWVKVLPDVEPEIVIVPVNGATLQSAANLQTDLNQIYAQANVKFTVTIAENFANTAWDLNADNTLQTGDPHLMTNYSDEMRQLRDAYFEAHPGYNKDAYHLFVVSSFEDTELAGYMVRGKGVGFLKNGEDAHTAAHELGHGVFGLEHTFPEVAEGTSDNLMDYGGASHLAGWQWELVGEPLPVVSVLDDEEEGEYVLTTIDYLCIPASITKKTSEAYYLDLDGQVILLTADYEPYAFVGQTEGQEALFGRLAAFKRISDGKLFKPKSSYTGLDKTGYFAQHYGIYEEYEYSTVADLSQVPLEVKIDDLCDYKIYQGNNLLESGTIESCKSCPGIAQLTTEATNSFFEERQPNFYAFEFEDGDAFKAKFNESVDEAVLLVNASLDNFSTAYPNDQDIKLHIIGYDQFAGTTPIGIAGGKEQILSTIDHKLQDLYRTSHDHGKPIHFVVAFQYIDFLMTNKIWNHYAGKVLSQSDLSALDNVVLITIPYALPPLDGGTNPQQPFWMPGLSMDKPNLINTSNLQLNYYAPENFEQFILDVFIQIVKPLDTYTYVLDFYGNVQFAKLSPKQWVSGYDHVNQIELVYDKNFKKYDKSLAIEKDKEHWNPGAGLTPGQQQDVMFLTSFRDLESSYREEAYTTEWISPHVNLLDYYIRRYHSQYVNHFICQEFNAYRIEYVLQDPGDIPSYTKINPLEGDSFLALVDFFSLITSPLGGDVVFDFIGVVYVRTIDADNTFEIGIRTAAVVLPFLSGGVVKIGQEGVDLVTASALKNFGTKGAADYLAGKVLTNERSWLPNREIVGNLENPIGIIGVYERELPDGTWIRDTKNALNDISFPETYASNFVNASKDGFRMLNTNQFYWSNPEQFWNEFNTPWLAGLKASKTNVAVLSDKTNDLLLYKWTKINGEVVYDLDDNFQKVLTGFGKEIEYMDNLVSQGFYQWDALGGIYKYIGP